MITIEYGPARMLLIVGCLFVVMKCLVLRYGSIAQKEGRPHWIDTLLFIMPWPGMNPRVMALKGEKKRAWFKRGAICFLMGTALIGVGHTLAINEYNRWLTALSVMMGWSLILHFGIFSVIAAFYREMGYRVSLPFGNPWMAKSLEHFWGNLWNRPFIEMTVLLVLRPLQSRGIGPTGIMWASFLFSGFLHECAISLPAQGGYGGPLLYFIIQGFGICIERIFGKTHYIPSCFWVWGWIMIPLPCLFHEKFIFEIMLPMAGVRP